MKRLLLFLFASLCLSCLVAADLTGGYMCRAKDYIVFVRLTQLKDNITGFMTIASYVPGEGLPAVSTYRLKGAVAGKAFSLVRDGGEGSRRSVEGKVMPTGLEATMPTDDGYVVSMNLRPATDAAWNKLVEAFGEECTTRFFRNRWRSTIEQWVANCDSQASQAENLIKDHNKTIDETQRKIVETNAEVKKLETQQAELKAKAEESDRQAAKIEAKLKELMDQIRQKYNQDLQLEAIAADASWRQAKIAADQARNSLRQIAQTIEQRQREVTEAQQVIANSQQAVKGAKDVLVNADRWHKTIREAGLAKRLRTWPADKYWKAKTTSELEIFLSPDEGIEPYDKMPVSTVLDVLPLDNGWFIVRIENGFFGWAKASKLKVL